MQCNVKQMRHKYCIVCYDIVQTVEQVLCLNCYERFQESNMSYVMWLITRQSTAKEMMINISRDGKARNITDDGIMRLYLPKQK